MGTAPPDRGDAVVSRRMVLGATLGGVGAASLVGLGAAAMWPERTSVVAAGSGSGDTEGAAATATAGGAEIDFTAAPAESWKARDPRLAAATDEKVRRIEVHATEVAGEVAPGVEQQLWTYDDLVPGPVYRGRLGDRFEFVLVNDGAIDHSVDFHASKVAWSGPMQSIAPGTSIEYAFEAKHAGIYMYHCGTPPVLHHIGAGMHGALIVDPPDLVPVDHEFIMIQSEIYTGPAGEVADYAKMQHSAWDAVVFNGYVNQYKHRPIRVEVDERIRVWVLNSGPSENCSFHVIGTIADTVYKEGGYRIRPDEGRGGSQALDLQPAQGGFIEFTFDEEGFYPFVTHKFATAQIGALGLFQVGDVEMPGGGASH